MGKIICKGKEYQTVDDMEYRYIRKWGKFEKKVLANEIDVEDLDKDTITLFANAICPDLLKDFVFDEESTAINGIELTISELRKLIKDLRNAFLESIKKHLNVDLITSKQEVKEKNEQQEEKTPKAIKTLEK